MAFESVDANSLISSINSMKSSINASNNSSLILKANSNMWQCDSKNNIVQSLTKLGDIEKQILDLLNSYSYVASLIKEYKDLEQQNVNNTNQINALKPNLYKEESYDEEVGEGEDKHIESRTRTVKDNSVENSINSLNNSINANNTRMIQIENEVRNIIGG